VTVAGISDALASFVRTLVAGDAPVDRFLLLGDSAALSPQALRGFALFRGKAGCVRCHEPRTSATSATTRAWRGRAAFADSGRYEVTRRQEALGSFKTPTLRNVALTAPYLHDGSIATLDSVVAFYARGGSPNPQLDPLIRPLDMTASERSALLAFLRALTGRLPGLLPDGAAEAAVAGFIAGAPARRHPNRLPHRCTCVAGRFRVLQQLNVR
jgi:cytochrome c peroxidase